ncbi:hypothetical protein CEXT_680361 [Caerostris extrusa]|uniref:Uncharacterized protein n=1 Tax=Caerostris extrusa TaxID=172846 RepID=A0AAV4N8G3_CAEEX|nr:hypothetical protein CEXT_680361 [Caerostris extrusa]
MMKVIKHGKVGALCETRSAVNREMPDVLIESPVYTAVRLNAQGRPKSSCFSFQRFYCDLNKQTCCRRGKSLHFGKSS